MKSKTTTSKSIKKLLTPYYFLLPVAAIMSILVLYPVATVFYYSFQNYNPNKDAAEQFVGIANFIKIFTTDKTFWKALLISAKWVVMTVAGQFLIGLTLSLLLNIKFKGRGIIRALIFAPWALSGVVIAILWSLIYSQHIGVINDILLRTNIISEALAWVANPNTAFGAVAVAEIWAGIPFFTISLLAQMQSIPLELYESCDVDGGGSVRKFWYITLPYLKDAIVLNCLIRGIWEFNSVDLILNLTGGGPAGRTTSLSIYLANQAIKTRNFGYGSAIGVVTFMIMLLFSIVYLRMNRYEEGE